MNLFGTRTCANPSCTRGPDGGPAVFDAYNFTHKYCSEYCGRLHWRREKRERERLGLPRPQNLNEKLRQHGYDTAARALSGGPSDRHGEDAPPPFDFEAWAKKD